MVESISESSSILMDLRSRATVKVLHVDDDLSLLKIAKKLLEMQGGFEVDTASCVEEATDKLKKGNYDAIVSDFEMPGKDGLEFLKELRTKGNPTPFIIFTGKGREEVAVEALNSGADYYLSKTLNSETIYPELANHIRIIVGRRRAERHRMVEALKQSEATYRTLAENLPVAVYREYLEENGKRQFFNDMVRSMTGYASEELTRGDVCSIDPLIVPEDRARVMDEVKSAVREKRPFQVEYRVKHRNGSIRHFQEWGRPTSNSDGNPLYIDGVIFDVTEHAKIASELTESEEKYSGLVENAAVPIGICDLKGRFTFVNNAMAELLGYSAQELTGRPFQDFLHPADKGRIMRLFLKIIVLRREPRNFQFRAIHRDGHVLHLMSKPTKFITNGKTLGFQAILIDISELKKAGEELQRFSAAVRASIDGVVMSDLEGRIVELNDAALRFYGADAESDLIGKSSLDVVPPQEREKIAENMREVVKKGYAKSKEINIITKRGAKMLVDFTTTLVKDSEDRPIGFLGIIRDLTERRKAEQTILESQQKFERLFMDNPEPAVYVDSDFRVVNVNPRFSLLFGYSLDEVRGKNINDVAVPKDRLVEAEMLDKEAKKAVVYHDTVRRAKDGSLIQVSVSAAPIVVNDELLGYIALYKDISLLKKTENELKETMKKIGAMNEKLLVVGGLTRHDARNKLAAIMGNAYLAKKKLAENSEVLEYLKEIEASVQQTTEVFEFAKTYEMLGVENLTYIDVEKTIREAASLFPDLRSVKLTIQCSGLTVLADSLLRQLFYNLIDNSLKHGEKTSQIKAYCEKISQGQLKLIYEDDGVGILSCEKPKLFSKGYTTGKGSGYGLYLIRKMVEVYGWTIEEEGKPGKGVMFVMKIPKTSESGRSSYRLH